MIKILESQSSHYKTIKEAIEYIDENFKDQPSLDDIALHVKLSKYHFSRIFKEYVGVTPMQFLQAVTLQHAKKHLKNSQSLLDTAYESGLSSPSRLHELFINFEGVSPNEYKKMGKDLTIIYGYGMSPFGKALLGFSDKGICYMEFCDDNEEEVLANLEKHWQRAELQRDDTRVQSKLDEVFVDKKPMSIMVKGTNFQISVWRALLNIPHGLVTTYQDIADSIEKPKAVRAIASAIGSNHIAYLIPCHRVIGKSGAMSGYRWGISRKRIVLAYEELSQGTV